jgi:hypothetical protein
MALSEGVSALAQRQRQNRSELVKFAETAADRLAMLRLNQYARVSQ